MNIVKPTKHIIRINKIGYDTFSAGLKGTMEDENPFELAKRVNILMAQQWARGQEATFMYQLALEILYMTNVDDVESLKEDFEKTVKELKKRESEEKKK